MALPNAALANEWTGAISSNWFVAGNWTSPAAVPTVGDNANIDGTAPNYANIVGPVSAVANIVTVGVNGPGLAGLAVYNGAMLTDFNGYIGYGAGSNGAVDVVLGGTWTNDSSLYVGYDGYAKLDIASGGKVSDITGYVGYNAGSTGLAIVEDAGSVWVHSSGAVIGEYGDGTLVIKNGGSVVAGGSSIGRQVGSTGKVTVNGVGSNFGNAVFLTVGDAGAGTLIISGGGKATNATGTVGAQAGSIGEVTVDAAGSIWTNSLALTVGSSGTGALTVSNDGTVSTVRGIIGANGGAIGTVTVTDAGSTWTSSDDLVVGRAGAGTLNILNGGAVSNVTGGVLGAFASGTGTATVSGAGSSWTNNSDLFVGNSGTGSLTIAGGGVVSNANGLVGNNTGSTGMVMVTGAGSAWTNIGNLGIGDAGAGTLTIANEGVVTVGGVARIASLAGSTGTLNIGGAVGAPATAAGTLNAAIVEFGNGTGAINFNHTNANHLFGTQIGGLGTINQIAGNTTLTADSSGFTGVTNVIGGRLAVNGSLANSLVTVSAGGVLGGNGTVGGTTVQSGGIIAPGNSIGTLNINGNLTQAAGSIYQVELASNGQSDLIKASGTATIANGALLSVYKVDAGSLVLGAHYTVMEAAGGVSGTYTLNGIQLSNFIGLTDRYDATHVYLDVSKSKSFASAGLTSNQIATGGGADSLPPGSPLANAIVWLPTDLAAQYAFDQLSGEIYASARTALIEDSRFVRNAVNDRLRAAFEGVGGSTAPVVTYDADGRPQAAAANTDRLAFWTQGFGSWGHINGDGNAARLERSTGGFLMGADGRVFDTWRLGAVGGYSRTTFNVNDRNSSGSSDNYHLGLYGGSQWGDLALRMGTAYTWHDISTLRSVTFPGFADRLTGGYKAGTFQGFGEVGYKMSAAAVRFEPFANLAYVSLHTDGFTEKGGAAALTSASATTDATFTTFGLRAASSFTLGGTTATAGGMLGWRHAFGDVTPLATMAFAGGNAFIIGGVPITRNAAVIDAGLDFALTPNATVGVSYGGQFGSGFSEQSVKAAFNVKF